MMKIVASDMTSDLLQFHGLAAVVFSFLLSSKKKFATCRGAVDAPQCQLFFFSFFGSKTYPLRRENKEENENSTSAAPQGQTGPVSIKRHNASLGDSI